VTGFGTFFAPLVSIPEQLAWSKEGSRMLKTVLKLADVADVLPGQGTVVEAGGQTFALFNVDGAYYAIDNTCPHHGGSLGEGRLNGHIVTCPWHRHEFNVKTGEVVSMLRRPNPRTYPVVVQGSDLLVEVD
jgi:nitrite reductase/ring-hydroxylating ferredoxin subunit